GVAAAEAVQDGHQRALAPRGVAVEHVGRHAGEVAAKALLYFLRAEADGLQHLAVAERAARRNGLAQAAVMTEEQPGAAVHGERDAAVAAAELVSALAAEQVRRVAAPIDEDDDLLAGGERLLHRRLQGLAEDDEALVLFLRALLAQVDDLGVRER